MMGSASAARLIMAAKNLTGATAIMAGLVLICINDVWLSIRQIIDGWPRQYA
jgi:enoyl-CoA hydratase/carnithine racemase